MSTIIQACKIDSNFLANRETRYDAFEVGRGIDEDFGEEFDAEDF